nr:hypothetical protein [Oscillochloris trichoides]
MELIIALALFIAMVATWFVLPASSMEEPAAEKSGVMMTSQSVAHTA